MKKYGIFQYIYIYIYKKQKTNQTTNQKIPKRKNFIQAVIVTLFQLKMQLSLTPGKNKLVMALLLHSAKYPEKLLKTTKYRAVITKFLHKI